MTVVISGTNGIQNVLGSAATPSNTNGSSTNTGVYFPTSTTLGIATAGTNAVYVDASQNVGIGTSSPAQKLEINGGAAAGFMRFASTLNSTGFDMGVGGTADPTAYIYNRNNTPLLFATNNTERARIDSSGNLLVGTTTQVRTGDRFSVNGSGAQVATFSNSTNTSGSSAIATIIQSNGNNTSTYHFWGNTSGVGNWYLYGNGTTSYTSDARLKKNIVTTRDGYLEDICRLRVVKYNWKKDDDATPKELGLIAQEVEQIFPNLVQDDLNPIEEGGEIFKQVKHSVLPFMLLKAIQEQQALITSLTARIEALEAV